VTLAFGRKSGHGGYGPPPGMLRGARVAQVSLHGGGLRVANWVRQEDGSRLDQGPSPEPKATQQTACVQGARAADRRGGCRSGGRAARG
jgi:hypothetical protein